ncbi:GAF domain-containing protein, partial [Lysobacter sp. D1-1-M9]|uniref:GAF domain-containing protein n=1 Tax=Novilysobacter longmucuonensis TaxID=3098603 RepID=UPI002FC6874E
MPLLADATTVEGRARIAALVESGAIGPDRSGSMTWLGVPLACDGRTVGVLAVQSYQPGVRYEPRDQELLTFIGYQIANGLTRQRAASALKSAYASLELR